MVADVWYLIARGGPDGVDIWPLGSDNSLFDGYVAAACVFLGIPPDWDGLSGGWSLQMAPGEPAASLLAVATVHDQPPGAG